MLTEKWRATDSIFCDFGPPFALLPLSPPPRPLLTTQRIKILKKEKRKEKKRKKTPRDIIILHMCTKNHDHMQHCTWDRERDRYNFYFSFWATFCPITHPTPRPPNISKNQNFQKIWKIPGDIIILHMCTKHYDHMMYASCDMVHHATVRWEK